MSKISKKVLSVFLALLTAVLILTPAFITAGAEESTVPIIYVLGIGQALCDFPGTKDEKQIYPLNLGDDYIKSTVKKYFPVFAKAFFTQKWDEFCDVLYDISVDLGKDLKLDDEAEPRNDSDVKWHWKNTPLRDKKKNGTYKIDDYTIRLDWRLSPMELADRLNEYIEAVRNVTKSPKVKLVGRCFGAAVVSAYLTKYGGEHVSDVLFYVSTAGGVVVCGEPFKGDFYLDAAGINRFVQDMEITDKDYLDELIKAFVDRFKKTYGLNIAAWAVNNVYSKIYLNINPRVLLETLGAFPSFWSMINLKDFDRAKEVVFYGADMEKYKTLIEKIDDYHDNVQVPLDDTLKRLEGEGINFAVITKYGRQTTPMSKDSASLSDGIVNLVDSSFGATTVKVNETFSADYIEKAKQNGTFKYISPDKEVDASTCLFPDTTWIVKDIDHSLFPACLNELMNAFFASNGKMTIDTDPAYPQFLVFNEDDLTLSPMTEENCYTSEKRWNRSYFTNLKAIFTAIFRFIKDLFKGEFKK
ncbi:MAG: hypothetical protein K6F09_03705 [Clostridiales bacterium]|nr:hypothetical protein [Clostridiales bacterium]